MNIINRKHHSGSTIRQILFILSQEKFTFSHWGNNGGYCLGNANIFVYCCFTAQVAIFPARDRVTVPPIGQEEARGCNNVTYFI